MGDQLPSRADAIEMMAWHSQRLDSDEVWALIAARASGRLVDRKAIDYERIEEILLELCGDWYDMVIREGKTYDFGAAIRALVAAIGEA